MSIKQVLVDGDERHPIWRIANTLLVLVFVSFVMWVRGEPMDSEFITWLLGMLGAFEVSKAVMSRKPVQ